MRGTDGQMGNKFTIMNVGIANNSKLIAGWSADTLLMQYSRSLPTSFHQAKTQLLEMH